MHSVWELSFPGAIFLLLREILRLFENNCVYIDTTHNKGDANMLIDIHRAANVERHNYLLDQAEQWRLEKLADLTRRVRTVKKKTMLPVLALSKSDTVACCSMAAT